MHREVGTCCMEACSCTVMVTVQAELPMPASSRCMLKAASKECRSGYSSAVYSACAVSAAYWDVSQLIREHVWSNGITLSSSARLQEAVLVALASACSTSTWTAWLATTATRWLVRRLSGAGVEGA